ncbi:unnamed protein product [Peniophora sp. CBMAI 1063]|nr:unnamed protein product [Peniophora sp. CBMAI 1063]
MSYPAPVGGASLLLAFRAQLRPVLIVGANQLAASRALSALEADYPVTVLSTHGLNSACDELRWRSEQGQLKLVDLQADPSSSTSDLPALVRHLDTPGGISLVCVADTILSGDSSATRRTRDSAQQIVNACRARNIPVNVTDMPDLCDFTFASTHRFTDTRTNEKTPLQVAVLTNGQGCRLSSRLRREIVAKIPRDAGAAVARVGQLRRMARDSADSEVDVDADGDAAPTPNAPVPQRVLGATENGVERTRRRMKWVAQVSEYWPYSRLAEMSDSDMAAVLSGGETSSAAPSLNRTLPIASHAGDSEVGSLHALDLSGQAPVPPPGRIYLLGSGPGHPGLLTVATRDVLTARAELVLSDKLVPEAVLALIPPHVEVRIARKFPGNAEGAQNEMMEAAVEAARRGITVVRLKQGDPTVYGRAGEEILYFRQHGLECTMIPGVSSALAGPVFAGIPVTQRGAAESMILCTGVGRAGKEVSVPGYVRSRTLVMLMGVARLPAIVDVLTGADAPRRSGEAYPLNTPVAIIERASMPDQRVLTSTLQDIVLALNSSGEQRPPGMIVVGWSVLSLWGSGDVSVLDADADGNDASRVQRWLNGEKWRLVEGVDEVWEGL